MVWGYGMGQKECFKGEVSWIAFTILSRSFGFPIHGYISECTDHSIHIVACDRKHWFNVMCEH